MPCHADRAAIMTKFNVQVRDFFGHVLYSYELIRPKKWIAICIINIYIVVVLSTNSATSILVLEYIFNKFSRAIKLKSVFKRVESLISSLPPRR